MYLLCVSGNFAKGRIGVLNLSTYMSIGFTGPAFFFAVFFVAVAAPMASANVASPAPSRASINFFAFVVLVVFLEEALVEVSPSACAFAALGGLPLFLLTGGASSAPASSVLSFLVAKERTGTDETRNFDWPVEAAAVC